MKLATDALDEIRREVWNEARSAGHKQHAKQLKGAIRAVSAASVHPYPRQTTRGTISGFQNQGSPGWCMAPLGASIDDTKIRRTRKEWTVMHGQNVFRAFSQDGADVAAARFRS